MNNNTDIHYLINKININDKTKRYFTKLEFYKIIEDKIYLSNQSKEINESRENQWSFAVDLKYCNAIDILEFYKTVIGARRKYLFENNISDKLVFYSWYDAMSGCFYFSIIPKNWSKLLPYNKELPFGCTINKVSNLEDIISNFINDSNKGIVPTDELEEIDPTEKYDDDEKEENYILDVWSIIL